MIRGTTPILHFDLPIKTSLIKSAEITIEYEDANKSITLIKTLKDCKVEDTSIALLLTQEETLRLPAPSSVHIQLRVLTFEGVAMATEVYTVPVNELLAEGVIV